MAEKNIRENALRLFFIPKFNAGVLGFVFFLLFLFSHFSNREESFLLLIFTNISLPLHLCAHNIILKTIQRWKTFFSRIWIDKKNLFPIFFTWFEVEWKMFIKFFKIFEFLPNFVVSSQHISHLNNLKSHKNYQICWDLRKILCWFLWNLLMCILIQETYL